LAGALRPVQSSTPGAGAAKVEAGPAPLKVLGPAASAIPRLRGRYREQILVKGSLSPDDKTRLLAQVTESARGLPGVEFQVDVDPVNML